MPAPAPHASLLRLPIRKRLVALLVRAVLGSLSLLRALLRPPVSACPRLHGRLIHWRPRRAGRRGLGLHARRPLAGLLPLSTEFLGPGIVGHSVRGCLCIRWTPLHQDARVGRARLLRVVHALERVLSADGATPLQAVAEDPVGLLTLAIAEGPALEDLLLAPGCCPAANTHAALPLRRITIDGNLRKVFLGGRHNGANHL
mmetsp:Transcript_60460/g.155848  ORF Transcript_60460/g.155848 Transcript_60460/m.155848 type:complete len:201 (+) Transcript_60460:268-870(+)